MAAPGARAAGMTFGLPLDTPPMEAQSAAARVKTLRTADRVVGGFRYESGSRQVGSLLLGLYDDAGQLDHVGGHVNDREP